LHDWPGAGWNGPEYPGSGARRSAKRLDALVRCIIIARRRRADASGWQHAFVVFNQKGGSASRHHLQSRSHQRATGLRTLVVDLDPQGNSTRYLLGAATDELRETLAEFFDQTLKFSLRHKGTAEFVVETRSRPASAAVEPATRRAAWQAGVALQDYKLRDALAELGDAYDRSTSTRRRR